MMTLVDVSLVRWGKKFASHHWPFLILVVVFSVFALSSIDEVPFHPDESSYLFQARDIREIFKNPETLFPADLDVEQKDIRYQLIDPPVTSVLFGLGLAIGGESPLRTDWNWGLSVEENTTAGALPTDHQLQIGRLTATVLLILSLILLYTTGFRLAGPWVGIAAALLFGMNSLVLLHGRRAMTESALLFGTILVIWALIRPRINPFLLGFAFAVAINAKHSAVFLAPAAIAAVVISARVHENGSFKYDFRQLVINSFQFAIVFGVLTILINPIYWRHPGRAFQFALQERSALIESQIENIREFAPNQLLESPPDRLIAFLANGFILEPSIYDIGNYVDWTAASETAYLSRYENRIGRTPIGGFMLATIFIFGVASGTLAIRRLKFPRNQQYLILLLATASQILGILFAISIPWQRYIVPAVPFFCIWSAIGLYSIVSAVLQTRQPGRTPVSVP